MQYMGGEAIISQSQGQVQASELEMKNINADINKIERAADIEDSQNDEQQSYEADGGEKSENNGQENQC